MTASEAVHIVVEVWQTGRLCCEALREDEQKAFSEAMATLLREDARCEVQRR